MSHYIYDVSGRVRPVLKTPKKGSKGDLTNESMLPLTDINSILQKYAGNLEDLRRWQNSRISYGDSTLNPSDLQEATEIMERARYAFDNLQNNPFKTFDEAMEAIKNNTFDSAFNVIHDSSLDNLDSIDDISNTNNNNNNENEKK